MHNMAVGLGGVMRPSGGMNNWGAGLPQQAQRQDRQLLEETIRRHKAAQLARAAVDEDANRVKELLTERADPNVADTESRWPLTQAAFAGEACVVSLLLEARADPNLPQEGDRAIHVSAWQGDKAVTSLLLKSSADVEATDSNGCSPLCGAALKGHLAVVDLLLSHGADPARSVNVTGHGTLTPLKAAQDGRSAKVVEKLKDALAAVSATCPQLLQHSVNSISLGQNSSVTWCQFRWQNFWHELPCECWKSLQRQKIYVVGTHPVSCQVSWSLQLLLKTRDAENAEMDA